MSFACSRTKFRFSDVIGVKTEYGGGGGVKQANLCGREGGGVKKGGGGGGGGHTSNLIWCHSRMQCGQVLAARTVAGLRN